MHYFIGGFVNCDDLEGAFGGLLDATAAKSLALLLLGIPKNLWRDQVGRSVGRFVRSS